jgi:ABC-type sulfate transport system permease component
MKFFPMTFFIYLGSIILFFLFAEFINGDLTGSISIGSVILLMLSIIIALLVRILQSIKNK